MARFLAIHNVSGLTEEAFREKLSAVSKWRPDRRTTILKVYGDLKRGAPPPTTMTSQDWLVSELTGGWPMRPRERAEDIRKLGK